MTSSGTIGAPATTSSPYAVSLYNHPTRVGLIRTAETVVIGKYSGYLEVRFSANHAVRPFSTAHLLANNLHVGRSPT